MLSATINEFALGSLTEPLGIASGPDGNLWFVENNVGRIGRINPTTDAITSFPIPTARSLPVGIAAGADGNLWFTESNGNKIGQINPTTGVITEFPLPTAGADPLQITSGPDGNLWFTERFSANVNGGGQIGMINPTTHAIAEFPTPTANSQPDGIAAGPDGDIWFTELTANQIGEISPSTHVVAEFPIPTAASEPVGITAGPDGNLWFTETASGASKIGQINPTTHAIAELPIPTSKSNPELITTGHDGNLWFTEGGGNNLAKISPTTHAIVEFPVPTTASDPVGIASGPDGNIWFAEALGNKIGQLVLAAPATAPDLALSGDAPTSAGLETSVTYTLTVINDGTASATGVLLTDTLPAGVTFVSATGGVTPADGALSFTIANLAAGGRADFTIVVRPTTAGTLQNRADVGAIETDPSPADNSITQETIVRAGPTVTKVERFGFHAQPTTLVLFFDTQLDARRAQNPDNYRIVALEGEGQRIRIEGAAYDSAAHTVTLSLARRLNLHNRFRLTVIGTGQGGVTDAFGDGLDGLRTGDPGSNFVTVVTARDLVLTTSRPAILRAYRKILSDLAR
jgi:uncharacterized repeat protein (TIGR01451 family)